MLGRGLVVLVCAWLALAGAAVAQEKQPTAIGGGGAAATVDAAATQAAIETLRAGGNAVDAAVAAAGVLGVTEPFSAGIGGGGFMLIRTAKGRMTTIDHRELSPQSMRPDSFMEGGAPLPFPAARYSGLSAGVPGTVLGWSEALRRYGTWSLGRALQPGIRVAREGFVVDQTFADQTQPNVPWFDDVPSTAEIYLDEDGTPRDVGTTLRNPDLARTYELIARHGPSAFYRGELAEAIVAAVRNPPVAEDADHTWRPGLMTAKDLKHYRAPERAPTRVGYRGLDVWGMGPPSSGGSTVGEALNILEGYGDLGADRTRALHLFLEASRFAFADRGVYLADPAFFKVPLRGLLSDEYAAQRRALIDEDAAATSPVAPGDPYPYDRGRPPGRPAKSKSGDRGRSTTHLVVSDRAGNVVSYTFTIESTGGNGIVVPGYGFLLNNELTDFNFDSTTHPNRADGGKRPRSSMAPTIVTDDGRPLLAVGSPGGSTIITTVLQVLVERLDLGRSLPDAVAAPRATQRNTPSTLAEPAFSSSPEGQALASQYGHQFGPSPEIGAVTALELLGDGRVLAAAEPVRRGGGSAAVEQP
ncbi:MAG TPA: gamma-glutamyltransferase [Solirubrobacteraceae bacterium]|nr:gamma-glutamyltransferase [Solirubrobacteraceae bacterium]